MRISLRWLASVVELPPGDTLADQAREVSRLLTGAGLEVEAIESLDRGLENVVAAEVRERTPVEGTKLSVCRVWDGTTERQVVCGAQNVAAGLKVPLARPGAVLPDGKVIGQAKVRGIDSAGMLCSGTELGADDGVDGLRLLPADAMPGTPIAHFLGKDDLALEINVTPNRADALSHMGVARDLSVLTGHPLRFDAVSPLEFGTSDLISASVTDPALCSALTLCVVDGVRVGPSPAWLAQKLAAVGQRSINNVVDATNWVLWELGQPTHAYDAYRLMGRTLTARPAQTGETLRTLDGQDRVLIPSDLVIADAAGPVGLAGVMGGASSQVQADTTRLVLESACFHPGHVRATARRLSLHSASSHRFERGVDAQQQERALSRLAHLIVEIAGGTIRGPATRVRHPVDTPTIRLRHVRLEELLGATCPAAEAENILSALGFVVQGRGDGWIDWKVPSWRVDCHLEADLVEEVVRIRGFGSVPAQVPPGTGVDASLAPAVVAEARARAALQAAGVDETVHFAFTSPDALRSFDARSPIRLQNPISEDLTVMRTTLVPGLVACLQRNQRQRQSSLRVYEWGRVYWPLEAASPAPLGHPEHVVAQEPRRLAMLTWGPRQTGWTGDRGQADFFDLKGIVERVTEAVGLELEARRPESRASVPAWLHPGAAAHLHVDGRSIGWAGELHPGLARSLEVGDGVFVAEIDADLLLSKARLVPRFAALSRWPAALRDVAVLVDIGVAAADVESEILHADSGGLLEAVSCFDVYEGAPVPAGQKNLAFALQYRSADRTLTDQEVQQAHDAIVRHLGARFGARLRGDSQS